jgi:molybdopterin converting factor small subunit
MLMVRVEVELLSTLAQVLGVSRLSEELPEGTTLLELAVSLQQRRLQGAPAVLVGKKGDALVVFIVNDRMSTGDRVIVDGDHVAILQPLAGG